MLQEEFFSLGAQRRCVCVWGGGTLTPVTFMVVLSSVFHRPTASSRLVFMPETLPCVHLLPSRLPHKKPPHTTKTFPPALVCQLIWQGGSLLFQLKERERVIKQFAGRWWTVVRCTGRACAIFSRTWTGAKTTVNAIFVSTGGTLDLAPPLLCLASGRLEPLKESGDTLLNGKPYIPDWHRPLKYLLVLATSSRPPCSLVDSSCLSSR